jgi:ubiquinone/menaquinone biosynthesis C-methylase UbiE
MTREEMKIDDAKAKAAATYNAAADRYDDPLNSFWARFGHCTINRLNLQPGQRVLDVCCGSGASAIPAAEKVGPDGSVLGIDLSEKLLALARAKANERRLENIEFRVGDMLDLRLPGYISMRLSASLVFSLFLTWSRPCECFGDWLGRTVNLRLPHGVRAFSNRRPRPFGIQFGT